MYKIKTLLFIITFFIFTSTNFAQKHYFGTEIGVKYDKFEYFNSVGYQKDIYALNGNWGFYFGTRKKCWNVEVGFYGFYSAIPVFTFDKEKNEIANGGIAGSMNLVSTEGEKAWVFPFRFSKEYFNKKKKLYLSPAIGSDAFLYRSHSGRSGVFTTKSGSRKTTEVNYRKQKITMGLEGSIAMGVRIKQRLDLYVKPVFYTNFNTIFYEDITEEYADGEVIHATNTFHGVAYSLLIGVKYNYHNLKQIEKLLQ